MVKNKIKVLAVIQARMGSKRFPGKILKKINGLTIIEIISQRLSRSKLIDEVIVATSSEKKDDKLVKYLKKKKIKYTRGDERNVLKRFYQCSKKIKSDWIVRITADCPMIDPVIVDSVISSAITKKFDYSCNTIPPTYPDGLDVECFSVKSLKLAFNNSSMKYEKEHVTPYLRFSKKIKKGYVKYKYDYSDLRLTLDYEKDLIVIKKIFNYFSPNIFFSLSDIINLYKKKPKIFSIKRDKENFKKNTGQKIWQRAKKIIPGGNMILSKRPEMYLPNQWPSYFNRAKGCNVTDFDNNNFLDYFLMGVGTNILGYSNKYVDKKVSEVLKKGNMSSLNCVEEVNLAEKLIKMHQWADMVRFARTGGEANSIAIRIARAATGKSKIAFCGYHGWHDWYLSANLKNKSSLNELLLKNLPISGVPENLRNSVYTFKYNDIKRLKNIVNNNNDIGIIKMEVKRNIDPKNNFLKEVRELASKKKIILIFDECTSGFRETFGGLHKKYNVEPDMAIFGKALGNGYAITSIIGRREIMESAQKTFISSTFWSERIGPTAALATLNEMERVKSWIKISKIGKKIKKNWNEISEKFNLKLKIGGMESIPNFSFLSDNNLVYKTFLTQEMMKRGFLAGNIVYVCTEHEKYLKLYLECFEEIMFEINQFDKGNRKKIKNLINGPICHEGFERLN